MSRLKKRYRIQKRFGDPAYSALYGTGCINKPDILFLFMNPTARNLTVRKSWKGLRAPWVGLKNTWKLFYALGLIDSVTYALLLR